MGKLFAILDLFRKGNAVADPAAWKNGSMAAMLLVPLLMSVERAGKAFGVELWINEAIAGDIAAGVVALVGVFSHLVSSDKVGLPAKRPLDEAERPVEQRSAIEP